MHCAISIGTLPVYPVPEGFIMTDFVVGSRFEESKQSIVTYCSRTKDGAIFCAKVSRGAKKWWMVIEADDHFALPKNHETPAENQRSTGGAPILCSDA